MSNGKNLIVKTPFSCTLFAGFCFNKDDILLLMASLEHSKDVLPVKSYKDMYTRLLKYKIELETRDE